MKQKKLRTLSHLLLPLMLFSGSANADGPRVVADIAPIHSLVSMVMDGVGQPQLLVPQNISPHHYSMRPLRPKPCRRRNWSFMWVTICLLG